jgi:hypothetical protein
VPDPVEQPHSIDQQQRCFLTPGCSRCAGIELHSTMQRGIGPCTTQDMARSSNAGYVPGLWELATLALECEWLLRTIRRLISAETAARADPPCQHRRVAFSTHGLGFLKASVSVSWPRGLNAHAEAVLRSGRCGNGRPEQAGSFAAFDYAVCPHGYHDEGDDIPRCAASRVMGSCIAIAK